MMLIQKGVCLKEPKRTIPATQLHRAIKTGVICFIAQKRALPMARNVVGKRGSQRNARSLAGYRLDCTEPCRERTALKQKKESQANLKLLIKVATTYSPTNVCSTIGAIGLNFSVRDGKRWNPNAIIALISVLISDIVHKRVFSRKKH